MLRGEVRRRAAGGEGIALARGIGGVLLAERPAGNEDDVAVAGAAMLRLDRVDAVGVPPDRVAGLGARSSSAISHPPNA